ncbi:TetR/AcrR family transcriptional regulator [Kitasatospora sp. MBT63]|uniref:TetR/AcrR family transcriptional regulator n=1 Tax=Kitasatospora sp. MBT63 TaxID=1444768 RepID=UPI00053AF8D1|nr:TetR/AcrR family transcriptional regulator [Kitasatospora sp. MBT63]
MAQAARTPRERYRDQIRTEVKALAREQIATAGASALSLNAIAKQMGMSGPALYRYFAGRDELITELISDAYRSLADAFRAAEADGADLPRLARTLRRWALDDPQRYFLIYGTPVPGYQAPPDTTAIAAEIMAALLDTCARQPARPGPGAGSPLDPHLARHRDWAGDHPAEPAVLRLALLAWTRLHGVLSLELAGQFNGMGFDPEVLFEAELAALTVLPDC